MDSSLSSIDGRLIGASAALVAVALGGSTASANLRAPRSEVANPSSAIRPARPASHVRVSHEDLTFQCHGRSCQVAATYTIDADTPLATELIFVLPVETGVTAVVAGTAVAAVVKRLGALPSDFEQHLDLRREYMLPDAAALPPLYQGTVRASFVPGRNQVSFSYEQPMGAVESDHSYFHDGTMDPRLLYVLWPLREWKRAPGFTIALRIAMDREPPGWWKRTFGHPATVACEGLKGQQVQVGQQLVYTASLSEDFPDYLRCWVGP